MTYWTSLHQSVLAALQTRKLGTPVFVRCTAATADSEKRLHALLACLMECASQWFREPPCRIYALGNPAKGTLSVTVEYPGGACAILSGAHAHGQPHVDLSLLGNQGGLYHSQFPVPARDGDLEPAASTASQKALTAIEQSLRQGKPVIC